MKLRYSIPLFALLLTGCNSGDDDAQRTDEGSVKLRVVSSIGVEGYATTRAVDSRWEAADQIGLFATNGGTQTIFTDEMSTRCSNLPYTFDDETNYETYVTSEHVYRTFTGTSIYLPATEVDIHAYYPYLTQDSNGDGIDDWSPTAFPIDVSDQTSQKAIDFMRADRVRGLNRTNSTCELLFHHKLVKIQFNLKKGADMLDGEISLEQYHAGKLKVGVRGQTAATYNIYTDAMTRTGAVTDIYAIPMETPETGYVMSFEALVLPTEGTLGTVTITIGTTANTFTANDEATDKLISGHKLIYNCTLTANSIVVDKDKFTEQW